jgi:preprotein translocase subunit SecD
MSERKRVEVKPVVAAAPVPRVRQRDSQPEIPKVEPEVKKPEPKKKVEVVKVEVKVEAPERKRVSGEIPIAEAPKVETKPRAKTSPDKYIRFSFEDLRLDSTINSINKQVVNGDIKYAYYATDNDIGYHYYIVIKK